MSKTKRRRRQVTTAVIVIALILGLFYAGRWGWNRFQRWLYPMPYADLVDTAVQTERLTPSLIYAVIQTESHFNSNARSSAGAMGLMQITPDTFAWLQTYTDDPSMDTARLTDPAVNIRYGSLLLRLLIERFGDISTALAAYNAGMGRVQSWLDDPAYSKDGVTLTVIPYEETRRYVEKVLEARRQYRQLYSMD